MFLIPKGPFHTKSSTALESVVVCHFLYTVFLPLLPGKKQAFLTPLRSVLLRPYQIFSPCWNSLSVVFLARKGAWGRSDTFFFYGQRQGKGQSGKITGKILPQKRESSLSGSNVAPLVPRYSCRAKLCRAFRLTFSQCRTRIALHPLKCRKKALSHPLGGVSHLNFAQFSIMIHEIVSRYRGCRSHSVVSHATLRH